jgi:hypothetical protein
MTMRKYIEKLISPMISEIYGEANKKSSKSSGYVWDEGKNEMNRV